MAVFVLFARAARARLVSTYLPPCCLVLRVSHMLPKLRGGVIFHCLAQPEKTVSNHRSIGMLGEHPLQDRQRAFQERPCPSKVALGLKQLREVVETHRSTGML